MTQPPAKQHIEVYDRNQREVVLDLGNERLVFEPPLAVEFAKSMLDAAATCGYVIEVQVPKATIREAQRVRLITRIEHVLRSLEDSGKDHLFIAAAVTDTVLAEVCA